VTAEAEIGFAAARTAHPRLDSARAARAPRVAPAVERRRQWQRRYRRRLYASDLVVVLGSVILAAIIQFLVVAQIDITTLRDSPWQYFRVPLLTAALWLVALAVLQTRATRIVGHGAMEYRRVAHATALAFGAAAIGFVILQSQGIRTQLLVALPLGILGLVLGRWFARRWLVRQRIAGEYVPRAIVVGARADVEYVVNAVRGSEVSGYQVVGVALDDDDNGTLGVGDELIRSSGDAGAAADIAERLGADAVIVASLRRSDPEYVKRLAWQLEGTAAELVLSSPVADVAGPRMALKRVEGLPLIQVQIPTFEGSAYAVKRFMDVTVSLVALVAVGVLTPFIALAIKIDSRGPVFFRQQRVGRDGHTFRMVKFRSMTVDAEARKAELHAHNEGAGPLFKIKADPRVTRVGAFLRRHSLDELPQFWNVLAGDMSVVGPRPPLPDEVTAYDGRVYRRLYIKPGMTGPWQISGRSDLSWDESVQIDLHYVENWSLMSDLIILWRTAPVMLKRHGAY
jgi:exopolysaccharide biosynthesis polyprenyl glycosylphosphotransferase